MSIHDFLTLLSADMEQDLLPSLATADNITDFFVEYEQSQARVADGVFCVWVLMTTGSAAWGGEGGAARAVVLQSLAELPASTRAPMDVGDLAADLFRAVSGCSCFPRGVFVREFLFSSQLLVRKRIEIGRG